MLKLAASILFASPLLFAQSDFFPMAVWYGGGKARAPMLESDAQLRKEIWRRDLHAIKGLGFTALAERARKSPAFLGWDLWSEPHVINRAEATYLPSAEFCYCPNSVARFRKWLEKKYGTVDELNRAWYRRFTSWDEVEPNRLSTILSYTDYIDWRNFITGKLAEDLRMKYDAMKRIAPDRVATSHADAPNLFTSPRSGDGTPDDWLMSRQVDYWGTSFYPKHSSAVGRDPAWREAS